MDRRVLVLVRHAKAVSAAATDEQRPLADRGHRDAAAAGRWLAALGVEPDLAVVSTATRARETWSDIAAAVRGHETQIDGRIYDNSVGVLLQIIGETPDAIATLVLVGHNPSMHGLAVMLSDGDGDLAVEAAIRSDYPTCGIAVFDVDCAWSELATATATLRAFEAPRG